MAVKLAKLLAWGALGFAVLCHLWASNRGLEMTDEASYLLIALNPWKTWGHGTFHGFLLRPLYLLGGSSVVGMRWIGYAAVLMAAWSLALGIRIRMGDGDKTLASLGVPVLMVAAMTVYCGGIRTPCYNWMILVGAMLAWAGWLRGAKSHWGAVEMGLGLSITFVGKWGASLTLLALFSALSLFHRASPWGSIRRGWLIALVTFTSLTSAFAFYAGWQGIRDTLQAGVLIAQTTGSHGWFIVPKYAGELLYYAYRIARAYFWLLPAILIFWCLARKNPRRWSVQKIATILFVAGLSLAALRGWWRGGIEQFGKESVLAGCWLLGVVWTVWAVKQRTEDGGRLPEDRRQRTAGGGRSVMLWGLVLTPFLCGIGTNTSIADYAGQGTVFFVAVGVLVMGCLPLGSLKFIPIVALAGLSLIQASRVSTSLLGMYRLGSVFEQTESIPFGPEKEKLFVCKETKQAIRTIEPRFRQMGFRDGDPLIGVDSLCGVVYLCGARSPGMPWFFRHQTRFLRSTLAILDRTILESAWILIRSSSQSSDPKDWWPKTSRAPQFAARCQLNWDGQKEEFRLYRPYAR